MVDSGGILVHMDQPVTVTTNERSLEPLTSLRDFFALLGTFGTFLLVICVIPVVIGVSLLVAMFVDDCMQPSVDTAALIGKPLEAVTEQFGPAEKPHWGGDLAIDLGEYGLFLPRHWELDLDLDLAGNVQDARVRKTVEYMIG
ncbi:MAG: hypothetical protein ABI743_09520 [bacterium]